MYYSDAYILVKGTITIVRPEADDTATAAGNNNKQLVFKNCGPFTSCISKINNTQVDNAKELEIVMPMYNQVKYTGNDAKPEEIYGSTSRLFLVIC